MSRVRLFHWREPEAGPVLHALDAAGHTVDYQPDWTSSSAAAVRAAPPNAIVIDLSRLPSHGREVAVALRGTKWARHIPIVFVGGEPGKVEPIRKLLRDAAFTDLKGLPDALKKAIAEPLVAPVVPVQMMQRAASRTVAEKLGIKASSQVALLDPPVDYPRVLGEMPLGVEFVENPPDALPVTLWFVSDPHEYLEGLPRARRRAAKTKLWVLWPKGGRDGITQHIVRDSARDFGLVDYKICSVNDAWSAIAFAVKKS
jgi:hypothetical protein